MFFPCSYVSYPVIKEALAWTSWNFSWRETKCAPVLSARSFFGWQLLVSLTWAALGHSKGKQQKSQRIPTEVSERHSCTPVQHTWKKQKNRSASPDDGFHERYLKLKREEIDWFAAIEEKKLEDPYSINKCITVLEGLNGLQMGDILVAADIFKTKENREVFLSFSSDALRLAWITREIGCD